MGELSNNILDMLFFLQDVLNIQVECVNEYLADILLKELVIKTCYEQLQNQASHLPVTSPVLCLSQV